MAKKKVEKMAEAAPAVEAARPKFEAAVVADERGEGVFTGFRGSFPVVEEPVDVGGGSHLIVWDFDHEAAKAWHAEAAEILELARSGNAVSPGRVVACLNQAVGLVPR